MIAYGAAAAVLATAATYGTIALASPSGSSDDKAGTTGTGSLQDSFASAAKEFGVPQSILMAVSYRQTLWDAHGGQPSTTGNYNVMGLTQVDPGDVAAQSASEVTDELNQSGDPTKEKLFKPDASLLKSVGAVDTSDPRLHTLDQAAKLIDKPAADLRTDSTQSVRGAAALLAQYEKDAYGSLPEDTGRWYAAVARYSQSPDAQGADLFASRVFETIQTGESRITDDGQQLVLPAQPDVKAVKPAKTPLATATDASTAATPTPECPTTLNCNFVAAAFKQNSTTNKADYGNYDVTDRPADGVKITSIVIHDTEGTYAGTLSSFQNPTAYASAHYLIRASDGLVTQLVPTKDTAWHAGNKTINMHSIGIEHEGYAIKAGSWYSEPQYESSAQLVKYLAAKFGIPLDREHIYGHDEVPGPLDSYVAGMHWDPGPYWDWNHYFSLIGAPTGAGGAGSPLAAGQVIRVVPPYTTANQPALTSGGTTQAAHPTNFGYLYTSASTTSARLGDPYLHSGTAGTTAGDDWGDKVVAGGRYVVAQQSGNWTAIWYGGKKGWFYNPGGQFSSVSGAQTVVTPAAGLSSIPVYGRAYPETAAYTGTSVPVQTDNDKGLTKYSIPAGQSYVPAGAAVDGDYFYAENYDNSAPGDHTLVTGTQQFYPIRYNHRIVYVKTTDVKTATSKALVPATGRHNVVARDSAGALWQLQGTGSGTASASFLSRYRIGTGFQQYNLITPLSTLNADGTGDLVTRTSSGTLWYIKGSGHPSVPFATSPVKVGGTGSASSYNKIVGTGDLTGDGKADFVARDTSGRLWLYPGTGSATAPFGARTQIASGWQAYTAIVGAGDVTGDGKADLLTRSSAGTLIIFKGTGKATAPFASAAVVSTGWKAYTAIVGAGDVTGDGKADLLTRSSAGTLILFKGTGAASGGFSAGQVVTTGWNQYNLIF